MGRCTQSGSVPQKQSGSRYSATFSSPLTLKVWCDADWAGCPLTRWSLTGWFIQLGNSPISWKTNKQQTIYFSSAKAEYRTLSFTVREVLWLKALLLSFGVDHTDPLLVHCDSMAEIQLAANPVFHERTKHVELDHHFLRDEITNGTIVTRHVLTKNQVAYIMKKALGHKEFEDFKIKLGICDLHAPT